MKTEEIMKRRKLIEDFIRFHPKTTMREIKEKLHLKIERLYPGGMKEAFSCAKIDLPRNFERKTNEENRLIILNYIKQYPRCTSAEIRKNTKINLSILFKNLEEAFIQARVPYPRKIIQQNSKIKRQEAINLIKQNPNITFLELKKKLNVNPYSFVNKFEELYLLAGIKKINRFDKRTLRKRKIVLDFIKNNQMATQRQINLACKTRIQSLFCGGVFGAYKEAKIHYPYERKKFHGIVLKEIRQRSRNFEEEIARKLSAYGLVNRLVKTKRGVADVIFERKNRMAIIEIKDYVDKEISIGQINQLNKYLEDLNCDLGFLICHQKPKKDNVLIGKNKIFILEENELSCIPDIIDGTMG